MKRIITHKSPDLDAIGSVWLILRFLPSWEDAKVEFVSAGEKFEGSYDTFGGLSARKEGEAIEVVDGVETIHADTGLGKLDHHQIQDNNVCAASLTLEYVLANKDCSLHRHDTKREAVKRIVDLIIDDDHFQEFYYPEAEHDHYDFSLRGVLSGYKLMYQNQDEKITERVLEELDSLLHAFEAKIWAENEIKEKGVEFETKWGKGLGVETLNDAVLKLAQLQGYVIVVRKDPQQGFVRIKAKPTRRIKNQESRIKDDNELLRLAASIEKGSEHSLAEAIVRRAEEKKLNLEKVDKFRAVAGHGVEGIILNRKVIFGNRKLIEREKIEIESYREQIEKLEKEGKTLMMLGVDGKLLGLIAVADTIKESAKEGVGVLQKKGIEVVMITGDNRRTADAIASKLGIKRVLSEVLPDQKEVEVKKIQAEGKVVAMVGDGINDAPALASADIGIAMGTGTDVAIEAAGITLINKDLHSVASSIELSKKTMRTIKMNLFWAFGYNILLIPVAMGVLYPFFGILLSPIFASVAMATSSISVVTNSLLLKRVKI